MRDAPAMLGVVHEGQFHASERARETPALNLSNAEWLSWDEDLSTACERMRETAYIVRNSETGAVGVAFGGSINAKGLGLAVLGVLPPLYPEWLGDRAFVETHNLRFPYVTGAMANGIASTEIVIAMAHAGMLGFFGAAGLSFERVHASVRTLREALDGSPFTWGVNIIHSPHELALEWRVAEMLMAEGVRNIETSAFMNLTKSVVYLSAKDLSEDAHGNILRARYIMAKISRSETAQAFMLPAPRTILDALVREGFLSEHEAALASRIPVAEDITVESDSGGHTDNRPLGAAFPVIAMAAQQISRDQRYATPIRVGAAGGLGTPESVAAAFAMGAAYVVTGSVNQACVESGLSEEGKAMLATAGFADVMMAPAADMFEMGVKVQVLKRGTMFGPRGHKLYELYQAHESFESMPAAEKKKVEQIFAQSIESVWAETRSFWGRRDPNEVVKAEANPKHKMALMMRWYLGLASRWAIAGENTRKLDYQIWCGPAMGAFNEFARGSFLEDPKNRSVVQVARNLLEGAGFATRAQQLRTCGVPCTGMSRFEPVILEG